MSEPIKPLPCPFCDGEVAKHSLPDDTEQFWRVAHKPKCVAVNIQFLFSENLESWNTRPAEREAEKRGVQKCIDTIKNREATKSEFGGTHERTHIIRELQSILK